MVENSHTVGWLPNLYEPLRNIGHKVADWFAPPSEASAMEDFYEISIELPGIKIENVDVSVHDNSLTIRGEKRSERHDTGRTYFFPNVSTARFNGHFVCHWMRAVTRSMRRSLMVSCA